MHFETLFCQQGKLDIHWLDGCSTALEEGEILLLSDLSQVQSIQWTQEKMRGILVSVEALQARESFEKLCALTGGKTLDTSKVKAEMKQQLGCAVVPRNPWNATVFETIRRLPPEELGRYCTFLAIELLYLICCDAHTLPWKPRSSYFDQLQVVRVQQIHDDLLTHLDRPVTIRELTQQFHISSTTLKTCFRQLYGQPIHKYIQECRARQAAELLLTTKHSIAKVANCVGYESVSQFAIIFRRYYQMTPAEYRAKMSKSIDECPNPHSRPGDNMIP